MGSLAALPGTADEQHGREDGRIALARISASNTALFLARPRVVAMYATAGLGKLTGKLWQNGTALFYILQSEYYGHPVLGRFFVTHPVLSSLGTYATIVFQLAFPFLIWNRKARPWLLAFGVLLHLNIALVMGLFSFGMVMILAYTVFFPEEWSRAELELPARVGSS